MMMSMATSALPSRKPFLGIDTRFNRDISLSKIFVSYHFSDCYHEFRRKAELRRRYGAPQQDAFVFTIQGMSAKPPKKFAVNSRNGKPSYPSVTNPPTATSSPLKNAEEVEENKEEEEVDELPHSSNSVPSNTSSGQIPRKPKKKTPSGFEKVSRFEAERLQREKETAEKLLAAQMAAERESRLRAERLQAEKESQARELEILRSREAELRRLVEERERKLRQVEEDRKKSELEKLRALTEMKGALVFSFPEVPRAGDSCQVYFRRQQSAIKGKPGVSVMGAFNNWQWKPFHMDLEASKWGEDWWTFTLQVPPEAYSISFVFHNSENEYENNGQKDFVLAVTGGMDENGFDRMIAEEKQKEVARLAEIEAQRARQLADERRAAEAEARAELDRQLAREGAEAERRAAAAVAVRGFRGAMESVWETEPRDLEPGTTAKLSYNRAWRPVWNSQKVWLHAGHNNWSGGVDNVVEMKKDPEAGKDGDWWSVEVNIPDDAFMLNWVVADGPPGQAGQYDNNSGQDFVTLVGGAHVEEAFFASREQQILIRVEEERKKKEEAEKALAQRRSAVKLALKERTKQAFLKSQQHILYTEPLEVTAGKSVKVFYNPNNTVLNGRPEVWIRGSFNRWTHKKGVFQAKKMTKADNATTHLVAEVDVPLDAYCMDFVFSDNGEPSGGMYDNKGGLDYHIPVVGGITKAPPMTIIHVALEMAPIAKVGGLGDVVTALSRAIQEVGHHVEVVLPKYDCLNYSQVSGLEERQSFSWGGSNIRCWYGTVEGVPVNFLEPENGMFWVGCIYGRKDDGNRFGFFCNAALEFLLQSGKKPDILHCHDWSSAPTAWLFSEQYRSYGLSNARTVFTIHNMEFGQPLIGRAMAACDKATTVSPTYAREVSGHGAISPHLSKFHGILNGIDPDIWDPLGDSFIPMPYDSTDVVEGKKAAKSQLQLRLGLRQEDRPMVGIVSRLTAQKGIHLIKAAIWRTLERGGQVVLLGSAPDGRVQSEFQSLAQQLSSSHGDMARLWLSYDEPLSHQIYAACDMIVVPSIFEPCGLTQMIAMRYGAVPVVRKTGGLNDTVFDVDHDVERAKAAGVEVNGFSFEGTDTGGMDYALNRAISAWYEARDWWNSLAKTIMDQDWTWNRPALDYIELYYGARK